MFYIPDSWLDQLLLDDIQYGDLTTRVLGIGSQHGMMTFARKIAGRVSGVAVAARLLQKLGLTTEVLVADGEDAQAGQILLRAQGGVDALQQGWKVSQNVLEWCCGVAEYMAQMTRAVEQVQPHIRIACTRKSIPGTKFLAVAAIAHGGGILHRVGTAETILLFANHRRFWADPQNWQQQIQTLRREAPEKKIIVEADTLEEAQQALAAQPDILQLDKFQPADIVQLLAQAKTIAPHCFLSVAGGVNLHNIEQFAAIGIRLIVTSAPYYAPPVDIKVILS